MSSLHRIIIRSEANNLFLSGVRACKYHVIRLVSTAPDEGKESCETPSPCIDPRAEEEDEEEETQTTPLEEVPGEPSRLIRRRAWIDDGGGAGAAGGRQRLDSADCLSVCLSLMPFLQRRLLRSNLCRHIWLTRRKNTKEEDGGEEGERGGWVGGGGGEDTVECD